MKITLIFMRITVGIKEKYIVLVNPEGNTTHVFYKGDLLVDGLIKGDLVSVEYELGDEGMIIHDIRKILTEIE